jgi:hypothetical protein
MRALLVSFGGGLTWAAGLLRFPARDPGPDGAEDHPRVALRAE